MKAVANDLGVSVPRLTKICDRFNIPYPKSSARAGKLNRTRSTPELPTATKGISDTIIITSAKARLSPDRPSPTPIPLPTATPDAPYHRELNAWVRHYKTHRYRPSFGNDGSSDEPPPALMRRLRLLNRIFRAAEAKKLIPKLKEPGNLRYIQFLYEGTGLNCELREAKALVTVNRFGQERREFQYTGELVFRILNVAARDLPTKIEWHEKKIGPLSKQVGDIVAALLMAGPVVVRAIEDRQESHRRWEAERLAVRRQQDLARQEGARRRALYRAASHYRLARELRQLITTLESAKHNPADIVGERSVGEWLAWAKAQCILLDPVGKGVDAFFNGIAETGRKVPDR